MSVQAVASLPRAPVWKVAVELERASLPASRPRECPRVIDNASTLGVLSLVQKIFRALLYRTESSVFLSFVPELSPPH